MRCPKCSYISFDMLENCVKCGKKISEAAVELEGTIASAPPPSFLRATAEEAQPEAFEEGAEVEAAEVEVEEPLDLGEVGEEEAIDFTLEEEPSVEVEEAEAEIDLGEAEIGEEEVAEIDLGEAGEAEVPEIDLGAEEPVFEEVPSEEEEAIGISDLAPSEEAEEEVEEVEAAAGEGLEDLEVEGIDLESAPGAEDTDKVMPSVKTGTALDDFDIDLGDLISSKD